MVHIGIDLHKRESQICWLDGDTGRGPPATDSNATRLVRDGPRQPGAGRRAHRSGRRERVGRGLYRRPRAPRPRRESRYAPMHPAARRRRHKNDERDAAALATASCGRPTARSTASRRRGDRSGRWSRFEKASCAHGRGLFPSSVPRSAARVCGCRRARRSPLCRACGAARFPARSRMRWTPS